MVQRCTIRDIHTNEKGLSVARSHSSEESEADARQSDAEHDLLLEAGLLLLAAAHVRMAPFGVHLAQQFQLVLRQHRRALHRDEVFDVVLLEEVLSLLRGAAWQSRLVGRRVSCFGTWKPA